MSVTLHTDPATELVHVEAARSVLALAEAPDNIADCRMIARAMLMSPCQEGVYPSVDWTDIHEYLLMLEDEQENDPSEYNLEWRRSMGRDIVESLLQIEKEAKMQQAQGLHD